MKRPNWKRGMLNHSFVKKKKKTLFPTLFFSLEIYFGVVSVIVKHLKNCVQCLPSTIIFARFHNTCQKSCTQLSVVYKTDCPASFLLADSQVVFAWVHNKSCCLSHSTCLWNIRSQESCKSNILKFQSVTSNKAHFKILSGSCCQQYEQNIHRPIRPIFSCFRQPVQMISKKGLLCRQLKILILTF